jgi:hypothetical protein
MLTVAAAEPKTVRRQSPRKMPKTTTPPKQKLTLYVSADGAKRLGVHATMLGTDRSALVDQLIAEHLKRFVVSDRAKPDGDVNRQDPAIGSTPDEESAS